MIYLWPADIVHGGVCVLDRYLTNLAIDFIKHFADSSLFAQWAYGEELQDEHFTCH